MLRELLLKYTHIGQPLVPTSFQLAGNQSVVGVNLLILTMRAGSFEPRLLKRILKLSPPLQLFLPMIVQGGNRSLDAKRLQSIQNLLGDRTINSHAPKREASAVDPVAESAANVALAGPKNAASIVIDSRHDSTRRLNQSSTTAR